MIVGIIKPTEGKVFFDEEDISKKSIHERCRIGMGYLAQEASIFRNLTVAENIIAILETMKMSPRERKKRLQSLFYKTQYPTLFIKPILSTISVRF